MGRRKRSRAAASTTNCCSSISSFCCASSNGHSCCYFEIVTAPGGFAARAPGFGAYRARFHLSLCRIRETLFCGRLASGRLPILLRHGYRFLQNAALVGGRMDGAGSAVVRTGAWRSAHHRRWLALDRLAQLWSVCFFFLGG